MEDLKVETDLRMAAEEKLRRLVKAGVIRHSWLECDTPSMSDTARQPDAPPQPQPESRHHLPRIRLL